MRPTDMRNRLVASLAVLAFGMSGLGLALLASRSGGDLPKLPFAAGGARAEAAADASAMMLPGRIEYRLEGELPALAREAPAYRLQKGDGAAAARRVAAALGMKGKVEARDGAWRLLDGDRELTVHDQPGLPWSLGKACIAPECHEGRTPVGDAAVAAEAKVRSAQPAPMTSPPESMPPESTGAHPEPVPAPDRPVVACAVPPCPDTADCVMPEKCASPEPWPPPRPDDLPDQAGAERRIREIVDNLGVDVGTLRVHDGITTWWGSAPIAFGGLPVLGMEVGLGIGPKGVLESANGWASPVARIGDYPLVGTAAGFDRLREGVGIGPRPLADAAVHARGELLDCTADTVMCDPPVGGPEPGEPVEPAEPHVVTIKGAHLALQLVEDVLVPVYVFEVDDGYGPAVPAVVDELLKDMTPEPRQRGPQPGDDDAFGCSAAGTMAAGGGAGGSEGENAPLIVEVCGPETAKVGEEVTFDVTVTDGDAVIYTEECGGPVVAFGDSPAARTECAVACTTALPADPEAERKPGRHHAEYRHTYRKAGTYTATFEFRSGPCSVWSSTGTGSHTVTVR